MVSEQGRAGSQVTEQMAEEGVFEVVVGEDGEK
jgi:hypothetical protein